MQRARLGLAAALLGALVAAVLLCAPSAAAPAPAAATPDDLLGLLLWAQAAAGEPQSAPATTPAPADARRLAAAWRDKHRAALGKTPAPKKAAPVTKKHLPPPKPTASATPAARASTTAAAAPWAPAPAAWAALEEYDRSERFAHSFMHGFRSF